jgi:hypothetical protein
MQRWMTIAVLIATTTAARAEVSAFRAPARDAALACDEDAMSDAAFARCEKQLERSAVRAFRAARAECKTRGPALRRMIANVVDPRGFGRAVIAHWTRLPADERRGFDTLADEVVGAGERNAAARMICTPGGVVRDATTFGGGTGVFIDLYRPEIDDCTQLMFSRDPARAGAWQYDGEWFCGVDIFDDNWRHFLGGGDYALAMSRLRAIRATSPR